MELFGDLLIFLFAGEMGRKCIQIGTKLSGAHTINCTDNGLAILIAIHLLAYFAELHYEDM